MTYGNVLSPHVDDLRRAFTNYNIRFVYKYRDVDVDRLLGDMEESISEPLHNIQKTIVDNVEPQEACEVQSAAIDNLVSSVTVVSLRSFLFYFFPFFSSTASLYSRESMKTLATTLQLFCASYIFPRLRRNCFLMTSMRSEC